MRGTKEIIKLMDAFEKSCSHDYSGYIRGKIERIDPNGKHRDGWPKDHFYTSSEVNALFKFYMMGYMNGRIEYMQ